MANKKRVQIDAFVIGAFMIVVGLFVLKFPGLYLEGKGVRDLLDVVGFVTIIVGTLFRMSARGYKKFSSKQGGQLVTGGPYKLVRNPMYLGTFLIGVGFMCTLYPLWTIVIFALIFYWRFTVQIGKEERWLTDHFGSKYEDYRRSVPPFIPTITSINSTCIKEVFQWKYLWTTKEKYGLVYWPISNVIIELLQERVIWGSMNYMPLIINISIAGAFLAWSAFCVFQEE